MNDVSTYLWGCLLDLCIVSYLAPDPASQIKLMVCRYLYKAPPEALTPLLMTLSSSDPVSLVRGTLEALEKDSELPT